MVESDFSKKINHSFCFKRQRDRLAHSLKMSARHFFDALSSEETDHAKKVVVYATQDREL